MAKFGWLEFPQIVASPVPLSPVPLSPAPLPDGRASPFDPDRKVAPDGVDEIDFDQRIAQWEALVSATGEDEENGTANDN